jgi:hypothetical protein
MIVSQKFNTHCQVCGGVTADAGDVDHREGTIEVKISWGPNSFDGVINEIGVGILGYAVYAVSDCGEKQGTALATIKALGVPEGGCCEKRMYEATIMSQTYGVTKQSFMVVPLTSIGAMDVGWVTIAIDDYVNDTNAKLTTAPSAQDQANALMSTTVAAQPASTEAPVITTTAAPNMVAVSMTLHVDYQQLGTETKDQLKGKIQTVLATAASVDPSAVTVMLSAGSVKVKAEIQTSDAADVQAVLAQYMWIGPVLDAVNTIPEVKAAATNAEVALTDPEVKMGHKSYGTLNMNQADGDASVATTTRAKQAQASGANSPRLELLLLLLPFAAIWV